MSEHRVVSSHHVVSIHYTLTDDAGQILESTRGGEPLNYVQGAGKLVPGLERQLEGRTVGDRFLATVLPVDGFGDYKQPGPQPLPRDAFDPEANLTEGAKHRVKSDDGDEFDVWIKRVDETQVYVDANHPLAGITLNFDVEIFGIRVATEDEVALGRPKA